jgi:hypothetical protein
MNSSSTTYWLDREDRISSVSGPWDKFANENGGINISADVIQGRSIWDYVTGDITRMWLNALIQLALLKNEAIERPYRCDSPYLKRYMSMKVTPYEGRRLRIDHVLLSVEERAIPLHTIHTSRSCSKVINMKCSICGLIDNSLSWEEPQSKHANESREIIVEYTVCNDCRASLPN